MEELKIMKTVFLLFAIQVAISVNGQSISSYALTSSGQTLTGSQGSLTFTVGELAVGKYTSTNPGGYQGFIVPQNLTITSLQNDLYHKVKLWPNPTSGLINILTDNIKIRYITIYDRQGRLIEERKYNQELDLSNRSSGLYVIQLLDDQHFVIKTINIIKQ